MKHFILTFVCIMHSLTPCLAGLHPETSVLLSNNTYIPLKDLKKKQYIRCLKNPEERRNYTVKKKKQKSFKKYLKLWFAGDAFVTCSCNTKFYLYNEKTWVKAKDLIPTAAVLCDKGKFTYLLTKELIHEPIKLMSVEINKFHNFCITRQNIVVHNDAIILGACCAMTAGQAVMSNIIIPTIGFLIAFGALVLARKNNIHIDAHAFDYGKVHKQHYQNMYLNHELFAYYNLPTCNYINDPFQYSYIQDSHIIYDSSCPYAMRIGPEYNTTPHHTWQSWDENPYAISRVNIQQPTPPFPMYDTVNNETDSSPHKQTPCLTEPDNQPDIPTVTTTPTDKPDDQLIHTGHAPPPDNTEQKTQPCTDTPTIDMPKAHVYPQEDTNSNDSYHTMGAKPKGKSPHEIIAEKKASQNNIQEQESSQDWNYGYNPQTATNKTIRKLAKKLGFQETKDFNFDSKGELVFKKGNKYITIDKTSHKGGFWKVFNNKGHRSTYNLDLTKFLGD